MTPCSIFEKNCDPNTEINTVTCKPLLFSSKPSIFLFPEAKQYRNGNESIKAPTKKGNPRNKGTGNVRDVRLLKSCTVMGPRRETRRRLTPAMHVRFDTLRRVGGTS